MLLLRAVEPERLGVVDHDCEDGHHLGVRGDGHEAGEETGDVGHVQIDGHARLGKCGLHDGVVLQQILDWEDNRFEGCLPSG